MKKTLITFTLLLPAILTFGQQHTRAIEFAYERDQKNDLTITADNKDFCDYYVELNLDNFVGYTQRGSNVQTIGRGKRELMTLAKNTERTTFGGYTYRIYRGNINKKVNPGFVYSLPVKSNDSIQFRIPGNHQFTSLFNLRYASDTVYASRGGRVCDDQLTNTSSKTIPSQKRIIVYHADGSFGEYRGITKVLKYPGEDVKIGQPIAIIEPNEKQQKVLTFMLYFLDANKVKNKTGVYTSLVPVFHTANKGDIKLEEKIIYMGGDITEEMLLQDMTKKEREKYLKNKNKEKK